MEERSERFFWERMAAGGVAVSVLRDRTRLTQLLILRDLVNRPDATLRELASALDVTPQAVSTHVQTLVAKGLVGEADGQRVVTTRGMQVLLEGLQEIKQAVDQALEPLPRVDVTDALAGADVKQGERVGLTMEDGMLVARPGTEASSRGVAVRGGKRGQDVVVGQLSGVVDLVPGRLWVIRVPGPQEGGSRRVDLKALKGVMERRKVRASRVGAVGVAAHVIAGRLGRDVDFSFAAVRAAFNAAELGLETSLLVGEDRARDALAEIDALNAGTLRRVPVETVKAPLVSANA